MTGKKTLGIYILIKVVIDFISNRQGIGVMIFLTTETLLHKHSFYIIVCFRHYTLHMLFIIHYLDSLSLTA